MPQTMIFDEKLALSNRALNLLDCEYQIWLYTLMKKVTMPLYLAKTVKETMGEDFLIKSGWDLSEASAEFGPNTSN